MHPPILAGDGGNDQREGLNLVERDFQIVHAIGFGGRQMACPNVDLNRRLKQDRRGQSRVTRLAQDDKVGFGGVGAQMQVMGFLLANCAFPRGGAVGGRVVVAGKKAGVVGQGVHFLDRAIQCGGIATQRKIATGAADVGHK